MVWRLLFFYVSSAFAVRALIELAECTTAVRSRLRRPRRWRAARRSMRRCARPARGSCSRRYSLSLTLLPRLAGERATLPVAAIVVLAVLTLLVQLGRRTARLAAAKRASDRDGGGLVARVRGAWRQICSSSFGLDLPREQVRSARDDELRRASKE